MEKENSNIVDAILVDDRQSLHPVQKEETDPELEVIKAGDELMDALDNAFAEFVLESQVPTNNITFDRIKVFYYWGLKLQG